MGLDQWIYAKTKLTKFGEKDKITGVCSGLFNIVPKASEGMVEIGYLRKGYDQEKLILDTLNSYEGCNDTIPMTPEEIEVILTESKRILSEHTFDEDGYDRTKDDPQFESDEETWNSKNKWEKLVQSLETAQQILKEDPTAEIYYHEWY